MMHKKLVSTVVLLGLTISLLVGCNNTSPDQKTAESKIVSAANIGNETLKLERNNWSDSNYKAIDKLINTYGVKSPTYDKSKQQYVVVDWDNTTISNDVEETLLAYQLTNLEFKMTPKQFSEVIRNNIPKDNFAESMNNKDNKPVNIDTIGADLDSDYKYLYENYKGLKGTKSLDEIKSTVQYRDFTAKTRYLYEAIGETFSSDISYPWVTYLFTGMNEKEVRQLAEKSIDFNLQDTIRKDTWTSPSELSGKAGVVSVGITTGLRTLKEQQNLYSTLMSNGIDVNVCSASFIDVVKEFATNPKYGYNIPEENVFAMELERDSNGVIQGEFRKGYSQTQGKGKTETIEKFLVQARYGYDPIMVSGDSSGDVDMLKDFKGTKLSLIVNRAKSGKLGELCKLASETIGKEDARYLLQGRDENKGEFRPSEKSIFLGKSEEVLLKK